MEVTVCEIDALATEGHEVKHLVASVDASHLRACEMLLTLHLHCVDGILDILFCS